MAAAASFVWSAEHQLSAQGSDRRVAIVCPSARAFARVCGIAYPARQVEHDLVEVPSTPLTLSLPMLNLLARHFAVQYSCQETSLLQRVHRGPIKHVVNDGTGILENRGCGVRASLAVSDPNRSKWKLARQLLVEIKLLYECALLTSVFLPNCLNSFEPLASRLVPRACAPDKFIRTWSFSSHGMTARTGSSSLNGAMHSPR